MLCMVLPARKSVLIGFATPPMPVSAAVMGDPVFELTAAPAGLQDGDWTGELREIRAEYRINCFNLYFDAASGIIRAFEQRGIAMDGAWDILEDGLDGTLAVHDTERQEEINGQRKDLYTELRATIRSLACGERMLAPG